MTNWHEFPMGPQLRNYLGIDETSYTGEGASVPSDELRTRFQTEILDYIAANEVGTTAATSEIFAEIVGMGLGAAALQLVENNPIPAVQQDFRYHLNMGSALMLTEQYPLALDFFIKAQALNPEEIVSYVNTAAIYYSMHQDDEVLTWASAGLRVDPSHQKLWEYLGSVYLYQDRQGAGIKIREFAEALNSHVGLSLAADMIAPDDKLFKAELLEQPYLNGWRDETYLIEYTAALGLAGQFEKIPSLLWQLEQVDRKKPSWQLLTHVAQAYFGLEQENEAHTVITRLEKNPETPQNVVSDLKATFEQQFESADKAPPI